MTRWISHSVRVRIDQNIVEDLQCQFSSDTIVAAAQLVKRGFLNLSTAIAMNEIKRKKSRQHSFNICVRGTALCLAQSVYSQCTQNVLSVYAKCTLSVTDTASVQCFNY